MISKRLPSLFSVLLSVLLVGLGTGFAQQGLDILRDSPRPELNSRDQRAIYLQDFLNPDQRVFMQMNEDAALYRTSHADAALGSVRLGYAAELLAFTEHGYLVRIPDGLGGNLMLGWVGRTQVNGPEEEFLSALIELEQRRQVVAALIEEKQVALGMTPEEIRASIGRPDEERIRQAVNGTSGSMSWVRTRQIPQYQFLRDPYTGQTYRQVVGYQTVEESRTDIEFENGTATAIERSLDNRRNRNVPTVAPPIVIPVAW